MQDAFHAFAERYAAYGYPVLFAGVLMENAGLPVPGETAVLVAGFLASPAGGSHFNIVLVIGLTIVAAVIGDNVGFWLGHRFARPRLQAGKRFLFLTPKTLELAEGYFHRYGTWTIFFARFVAGLRVVGALAAGTAGMHWTRFFIANAAGACAWATTMSLLGYFFGHSWELLHKWLGRGGLILLACVIVLVGLPYLLRRLRHLQPDLWQRLARQEVWQGVLVAALEVVCVAVLVKLADAAQQDQVTELDRAVGDWIDAQDTPVLDQVARAVTLLGTFPSALLLAGLMGLELWRARRPWREAVALAWAFVAGEVVGLALVGTLRFHETGPVRLEHWPLGGAAELVALRAFAVGGMIAYLLRRQYPVGGWVAVGVAAVLVLAVGASVVWIERQVLTEVLVEYAAGAVILFAGVWWLEGYGPGFRPHPAAAPLAPPAGR